MGSDTGHASLMLAAAGWEAVSQESHRAECSVKFSNDSSERKRHVMYQVRLLFAHMRGRRTAELFALYRAILLVITRNTSCLASPMVSWRITLRRAGTSGKPLEEDFKSNAASSLISATGVNGSYLPFVRLTSMKP